MSTQSTVLNRLAVLLNETAGSGPNIAQQLYRHIASDDVVDKVTALKAICEVWGNRQTSGDALVPNIVSDHDESEFIAQFGDVIDAMLKGLVKQNLTEIEFYGKLWSGVLGNTLLPDEQSRGLALHRILDSQSVPYFFIDTPALKMSGEDFAKKTNELSEKIARIRFILNRPQTQLTEDAELVLRIIRSCEKDEDQVVLLAHATSQRLHGMMKGLLGGLLQAARSHANG